MPLAHAIVMTALGNGDVQMLNGDTGDEIIVHPLCDVNIDAEEYLVSLLDVNSREPIGESLNPRKGSAVLAMLRLSAQGKTDVWLPKFVEEVKDGTSD